MHVAVCSDSVLFGGRGDGSKKVISESHFGITVAVKKQK